MPAGQWSSAQGASTSTSDLSGRYGNGRPRGQALIVILAVLAGVSGVAWLIWVTGFHGRPLAQSGLTAYEIVDDHRATATLTVTRRNSGVVANCLLRAYAEDHTTVGELNFTLDGSDPKRVDLTKSVRTEREATSVELVGCTADGQPRPR
ncbi:DUF4307 domain-containing protein [Nocardioides sp.]|uniref:DUF4307 domain-containing protein n=1 Tax=metagenome TaxID=256318 RepID=A0A2P2BX69_9ZZZZ